MHEGVHVDCRDVFGAVELLEEGGTVGCRDGGVFGTADAVILIIGDVMKVAVEVVRDCIIINLVDMIIVGTVINISISISASASLATCTAVLSVVNIPIVEKSTDVLLPSPSPTAVLFPEDVAGGHGEEVSAHRTG